MATSAPNSQSSTTIEPVALTGTLEETNPGSAQQSNGLSGNIGSVEGQNESQMEGQVSGNTGQSGQNGDIEEIEVPPNFPHIKNLEKIAASDIRVKEMINPEQYQRFPKLSEYWRTRDPELYRRNYKKTKPSQDVLNNLDMSIFEFDGDTTGLATLKEVNSVKQSDYESCLAYFHNLEEVTQSGLPNIRTVVVLVEDLGLASIDILLMLGVSLDFITNHFIGTHDPYIDKTLSMWDPYICTPFKNRELFPEKDIFHFDWYRLGWISRISRQREITASVPFNHLFQDPAKFKYSVQEQTHILSSRIYRPHQAIQRLCNGGWKVGAEERFSRCKIQFRGREIVVLLFDKPRELTTLDGTHQYWVLRTDKYRTSHFKKTTPVLVPDSSDVDESQLSSRNCFSEVLRSIHSNSATSSSRIDINSILFQSEMAFLRGGLMESCDVLTSMLSNIDEIDRSISNPVILQGQVASWQYLLSNWHPIASNMESNLRNAKVRLRTIQFEDPAPTTSNGHETELKRVLYACDEVLGFLDLVNQRCNGTFQAFMSSMSIIESQEAIKEANSVGKLTELAFLFIPLSFAATFYSMEISNLNPTLEKFFVLGGVLLLLSYGTRLFIRLSSGWRRKLISNTSARILKKIAPNSTKLSVSLLINSLVVTIKKVGIQKLEATVYVVALTLGLPPIIFYSKTIGFKISACLLIIPISFTLCKIWRVSGHRRDLVLALVSIFTPIIILAISLESDLETAIKVSICSALAGWGILCGSALYYWKKIINDLEQSLWAGFLVTAFLLILTVMPSALLLMPWSKAPQLLDWQSALIVISLIQLAFIAVWRTPIDISIDDEFNTRMAWFSRLSMIITASTGVPLSFIWGFRSFQNPVLPTYGRILLTIGSVWTTTLLVSIVIWMAGSRIFDDDSEGLAAVLRLLCLIASVAGVFSVFPLILWLGNIQELDSLSKNVKAGLTMLWVWFWIIAFGCLFLGYKSRKKLKPLLKQSRLLKFGKNRTSGESNAPQTTGQSTTD